ncbi:cupin domain-containing protein [Methylophaga sp.]|uniref:cupin domain-containing protein n=1 Tax=Methylophaga sp. TaxID=2024840 RepID=UPI001400BEF1|nr:cupin domain-containing protein [Methylophaga sp.]MTI62649.1 cupin domain-containing protein [Methylophaga sp.]
MTAFFNSELSQQQFLTQYWQKKPLLIRQALPGFDPVLSIDELAGLACEEEVESRLIEEVGETGPWQCRHGPFSETDYARLPESHWTLLVQDVDKHVPELAPIMRRFNFIPEWRRDDLMVSFAPVGGSVGPHTDGYDVFLLQAMGTRRWQISHEPVQEAVYIDSLDLKILRQFDPDESWDLQPGDMLYLPPHFAHHGVALNDCMTFSIGFRAPTQLEILDAFMQTLTEQGVGQQRYRDPGLQVADDEKHVDTAALRRFKQSLMNLIEHSDHVISDAVGRLLTETKPSLEWLADLSTNEPLDEASVSEKMLAGERLVRNAYIRLVWLETETDFRIYAAGESVSLDKEATEALASLTGDKPLGLSDLKILREQPSAMQALSGLLDLGAWHWEEVED